VTLLAGEIRELAFREPGLILNLPTVRGYPVASNAGGEDAATNWGGWRVPTVKLGGPDALDLLLGLVDRASEGLGSSTRFFTRLALLATELAARGRFLPGHARWTIAPGAGDEGRIDTLAAAMPGACLAAHPAATSVEDAREAIVAVLDQLMGALVSGVADEAVPSLWWRSAAATAALDRWADAVRPRTGPYRTLFRLREPGQADEAAQQERPDDWGLEILLGARHDPSLVLPAARVWSDPSPLRTADGVHPEEALLADLGRASRLHPPLAALLESAEPAEIALDTQAAHAFLREGAPVLVDAGFTVLLPSWWRNRRRRLGLRLRVKGERVAAPRGGVQQGVGVNALVEYDWRVAIGDAELTEAELATLAGAKGGLVRVRGEWIEVERGEIAAAMQAVAEDGRGGVRPALTIADVLRATAGLATAPGGLEVTDVEAVGWLGGVLDPSSAAPPSPIPSPPGFGAVLRPYQERGVGWLAWLDRLGMGGILADDMGLGKTVQLLALLVAEQANVPGPERLGPTLLVCPMSLVGNWQREAARFAPSLGVQIHHGSRRLDSAGLAAAVADVDLVLTTYALLARDREALGRVTWRRVVLDEAQEIKNPGTAQSRAARALHAPSRFALTGTPIENRLAELWTILDFANPGLLGSAELFQRRFAIPIERWRDDDAVDRLRRIIAPFILRRVKTDRAIVPELPAKLEFTETCNLTREQATLYQAIVDELLPDLEGEDDEQAYRGKVLRAILRLKQVCNHPALFLGDGSPLRGRSGKLERLEEVLDNVIGIGERALVFTQFTEWGERLVPYLRSRFGRDVLYLHGGMGRVPRDAAVRQFETGSTAIFVLSLKAGGKGLNLVAANHVLHYDRWWNPAVEDQASDRSYRIGQTRDVQVRTFVATGTLEEKIADLLTAKRELAGKVVRAGERAFTELTAKELRTVLALGADAVAEDGV
jgi:non-specific serine/threonine protein kinase